MTLQKLFSRILGLWKTESSLEQDDNRRNMEKETRTFLVQLVQGFGYPIEVFQDVATDDDYLLDIYRIPQGKSTQLDADFQRPVVLIVHSLMASCMDYVLMGPKRGLAYILADRGYDVWLMNCRGTKYSCKHKRLNPDVDKEYWSFSFHEIAVYDLVAAIKLIQNATGCRPMSYIGQSQGTTSLFILLAEMPQYNKLFNIAVCLAPINAPANMPSFFMYYNAKYPIIWEPLAIMLRWLSFPTPAMMKLARYIANKHCRRPGIVRSLVKRFIFIATGYTYKLDENDIPKILNYSVNPTSLRYFQHFSQAAISGELRKMDFGAEENLKRYGSKIPPIYNISNATCPIALFYSDGDGISGRKDVDRLKATLPDVVVDHVIEDPTFNHLDFSFAIDVADLLYKHVCTILDKYNKVTW